VPAYGGPHAGRGYAYFKKGDKERALADLDVAGRLAPQYFLAYAYRGEVHEARGERAKAAADYSKALSLPAMSSPIYEEIQAAVRHRLEALQAAPAPAPVQGDAR
jgi:tetratricopeptide (TPR) repeat protein